MACEILFKTEVHGNGTVNYVHPVAEKDKRGVYKKGYPVSMLDSPRVHRGYKEGLPFFCAVNVTDASVAEVDAMIATTYSGISLNQSWDRKIDFATVNNTGAIDGWRIRVFATNPGANDFAGITQDMVDNYMTKWNADVFSSSSNEVIFDVAIFEDGSQVPGAIQSEGFWGVFPTNIDFTETSYVEGTGVHTVEVDYSLASFDPENILNRIEERGGLISSDVGEVVTFTINRTDVFQWFQQEVKDALEQTVYRRQFRIPEATVDTIIATGTQIIEVHPKGMREYRVLDRTLAQVEGFLINRLDEVL